MDWLTVLGRIETGDDEQTEIKLDLELERVGPAIAAFANGDGGLLVLGVDDSGALVGIAGDENIVSERLTSFLQNGLNAPIQARLGRNVGPRGWIHWVAIPRQRGFEPLRHSGTVYVRRGRSSVEPSPAELADLYNAFGYIITEERTLPTGSVDDIDVSAFHAYLNRLGINHEAEPRLSIERDLEVRAVLAPLDGNQRPTVYGVMAFGRTPQAFPQTGNFFIQCVSYAGLARDGEVIEVADAKGRLDEQVDRAAGWLAGQSRQEQYAAMGRTDTPLLPPRAVREVIVNAVAHRDYAILGSKVLVERFTDRVEITSPGRFTNGLTSESVRRGGNPRARNQSMTNYLLAMGKMEQRGRGWPIIDAVMLEHNGTRAELDEDRDARWVRVTLWTGTPTQNTAEEADL